MPSVHIQVNREVSLRPSLAFSQSLDAFSQLSQKSVSAGHALIVEILSFACVWYARQKPATLGFGAQMNDTDKRAVVRELSERLGVRLIDDDDWTFDENGERVSACGIYWLIVSGHDDERLDEPIRCGQWPGPTESTIKLLWHRCVALSVQKAKYKKIHLKLLVAAGGVMIASLALPLLLNTLRRLNPEQFDRIWLYGTYLAAAGLGAVVALLAVELRSLGEDT